MSSGAVAITAIIVTGTVAAANAGALVYTVRRVSPWPKLPAPPQPPGSGSRRKRSGADTQAGDGQAPAADGQDQHAGGSM